ncbi:MAG TPA: hypothetical protein PKH07_16770, partial [bacterium]|nr:hypothetical protein [bacterium]
KRAQNQFLQAETLALLTILVVVLLVSLSKIDDYDIWFHTKSGEYYWNTRSLPQTDPFLFGMDEGVRDVSEWLSQLLMFFIWSAGGGVALQLANSLVLIATFLLLYKLIRLRECEQWLALAMTLIAIFVARRRWMPRPFQLVNLGIVILFWVVERWNREGRNLPRAWVFALWFMLWTNLHPGAYSGLALLVLFWVSSQFSRKKMPLSVPLASGIGSLLNVDLPGQLHKVLTCMTGGETIQNVLEHMPADMDWISGWFGVFALIVLATLPRIVGKRRWLDALLVAGILLYSFRSRRYIDLLAIIASPPVAQCFSEDLKRIRWNAPMRFRKPAIGLLIGTILAGGIFSMGIDRSYRAGFGVYGEQLPAEAVAKAQEFGFSGNCFCTYPWGGYLSFYNYPKWKVYIDGRCLMYGSKRLNEYFDILRAENWQNIFDKYDVHFAVIDSVESGAGEGDIKLPNIAGALFESPDWALVYWDDLSRLFVKRGCGYDPIIA